ncbi:Transmembrane domain-containing protein [Spironucleus salmonicida]|uniref:Transmembrane domain-containing protein n=1 Tax=Spironucleus salmonicida TaxID=348837 RepID=V6M6L2_9EUKA|nr:Transmembrane domain-containing protein [Spironucleus salmonicida]|eukprot:EST49049.1 Transmembrane domain-containing protein [Spironucleus salmonicida]
MLLFILNYQITSPLMISQTKALIDIRIKNNRQQLNRFTAKLTIGTESFFVSQTANPDILHPLQFHINHINVDDITYATLSLDLDQNIPRLINQLIFVDETMVSCLSLTGLHINAQNGILALLFNDNNCPFNIHLINFTVYFISDNDDIVQQSFTREHLNLSNSNSIDCNQDAALDSDAEYKAYYHCCGNEFQCYERLKQQFLYQHNQVTITVDFSIFGFLTTLDYYNIFVNSLQNISIVQLLSIDEDQFITTILLLNDDPLPSQIDQTSIQVQIGELFFLLEYDEFYQYFGIFCNAIWDIDLYTVCVYKIQQARHIINQDLLREFPVTIYLKNQKTGALWRRVSYKSIIDEVQYKINLYSYFKDGQFIFVFTQNLDFEIQAEIYIPGEDMLRSELYQVQRYIFAWRFDDYKQYIGQYVEFILTVKEQGLDYYTQYYYVIHVSQNVNNTLVIFFIAIICFSLSLAFLNAKTDEQKFL